VWVESSVTPAFWRARLYDQPLRQLGALHLAAPEQLRAQVECGDRKRKRIGRPIHLFLWRRCDCGRAR